MGSPFVSSAVLAVLTAAGAVAQQTAESLPAADGWSAHTIHAAGAGVWYLQVGKVVDAFGQPEVIAADDKGRVSVLSVYSGQWTAHDVTCDGLWVAPTPPVDVDARVPGDEIYAAGRAGSVHQITLRSQPFARFTLESREIAHVAGEEFHALIAADVAAGGGPELLAFGCTGALYRLAPDGGDGAFAIERIAGLPGRVRDAVVVPGDGGLVNVLAVARSGHLLRLARGASGLEVTTLLREDAGLGRIATARGVPGVHYVTRDDGVVLRLELEAGEVRRQPIFAGPQGLRGVAAGRFFADGREALAVYGYGRAVHLLSRQGDGTFAAEQIFAGEQKGHWLCTAELDGRNATDELLASGFDGRVVLLAREPGYGLPDVATAAAPAAPPRNDRPLRVAARFGDAALHELSPLRYQGGFETKCLVYEPLVRRGRDGRIEPGLAASWRHDDSGCTWTFTLREGARWHDGAPVRAADVAVHFRRWLGLPEHGWLRCSTNIVSVRAIGERELELRLARPAALLAELCAVNPAAVVGPGARDREGTFVRPVGSGPFRCEGSRRDGMALRFASAEGGATVDLVRVGGDAIDMLLAGDVDAVVGSWLVHVDAGRALALRSDPRVVVADGPGSSMLHLALRWDRGPLADVGRRRAVAAAIDRAELVASVEHGFADAGTGYAAPSIADWPAGAVPTRPDGAAFAEPLRFLAAPGERAGAEAVAAQLRRAVIPVELVAGGDWDLRFERTHGVPYDPFTTLVARFGRPLSEVGAAAPADRPVDPRLADLVEALAAEPDPEQWPEHYRRVQARLDELLPIVPLYAPRRIAIVRRGLPLPTLDHDMYRLDADWLARAQ